MCSCYSATSESAESPYNRVARVTRVLHTSCLCHQKSYRNVAWRVATMPGRPRRESRWWAPQGCPAWMTKSEVDVLWKPEDDLEGEFDRAVAEQGESATARRKLMNYFIFNSTEIADWQEETDRASWYLRTTGSLTLLLLRSKVETYKSATYEERGSEDWMDRLFAASWPSAVAPQAAQSGSEADDHLSGIDDDSPSVANGDDSSVQMETNAVAPQAAQSGSEADDNLSGIDDDSPSVANGDDSLVQMETNAVAPQAAQSPSEADDNLAGNDDDDDEMDEAMGAAEHEQGTNVLPVSKGGASASSSAATWSSFAHASANTPSAVASNGKVPAGVTTATFDMKGYSIESGKTASKMPAFQVGHCTNLEELLASSHKKARLTEALGQEIEVKLKPLMDTGIIINESLRQAWLGDKNGGNAGKCDSDNSNGVSNPEEATTEAVAASFVAAVIAAAVANVEAGNGGQEGKTADPSAAAAIASASTSSAAVASASASPAASTAAVALKTATAKSASKGKQKMTPEDKAVDSHVDPYPKPDDSDEEDGARRRRNAGAEARAGHKRTSDALEQVAETNVIAMAILAKDCSMPALRVAPSDPEGDRSVVWLQNHHLVVNIASQSAWRLFLMEHGEPTFCTKEIFAGVGLLRPGVSPLLLASAPICVRREALARNGKAGIPGDEIDLILCDGQAQKRGHAMLASVIRGMHEMVTLKPVGHHGYVVLTFLQCFTHEATFQKDEAWLCDNYPHLVPLLYKPAAIVMANNENSLADTLLLASVEDMSPGSKEAIFQKGRNSLLQKARHLIIDMQEKRCEDGTRLLFNHDRSGQPIVNVQQLKTMRWATDVFKAESAFTAGDSGHQGSESVSQLPAVTATQGGRKTTKVSGPASVAAGALSSAPKSAARPAAARPAAALAASSPAVASSCSKSSAGSKSTQLAKPKQGLSSLNPKQGQSSGRYPKMAVQEDMLDVDTASVVESLSEALGLGGSPTFDALDVAGVLKHIDVQAARANAQRGAKAAFDYIKGRTSTLVNTTWKNNLQRMETKAFQATTLHELRNVERMALSYYEDLVSAMNVLYSMALKYSASYAPQVKQSNLLKTHYENVGRAVSSVMARLEETANERKRSRGGTPPVHALSLMPPSQPSLPSEMVDVLKQIAEVGQTIAEAKRPRPEAKETDAKIRDLQKELDITKATYEAEAKHGSKLAAQASSFQAEQDKLKEKLHQVEMENAKMQASITAKAEMQVELTKLNQAHLESSNTASCFRGAMMMQSCTSFGAGGSSQQVMGAHQGWAALLGCSQSASGGFGSSLPMMAPRNRPLQELKGPADETSPMPPRVAQEVQELITEVERAMKVCSANQNFDGALALQSQGRAIKQTVEEIAVLNANLTEFKRVNAFEEAATTFRQLDEAVTKLNQQKDAVRNTLSQLF